MSTDGSSAIVVGVDGSSSSLDAVGWAARAAELRGATLRLVSAYQVKELYTSFVTLPVHIGTQERAAADTILAGASLVARRSVLEPDALSISVDALVGPPIQAMIDQSSDASLIVVGTRGNGEYFAELLGSVSTAVSGQAHCPVVIVPRNVSIESARDTVVVGVDASTGNERSMQLAFEEAALHGTGLVAAHVAPDDSTGQSVLEQSLAGWGEQYPQVAVTRTVLHGNVVENLLELSQRAQAVVIGSGRRGRLSGRLLGSTVRSLSHRVDCPLIIARG
ncbi:UspA domain protein [Rhodococcus sp. AW25M09]|uniref:universal stress protein n=1 Tax=Rhodococcus sp. AW25M09 TaxID=1268303 RepID=UPI0002ABBB7A|nr:universal stress protein [Rhodococcus sp. AW25M09]CCQ13531.1 UspA domain protein [Rhodococcus sp. AW25M09]